MAKWKCDIRVSWFPLRPGKDGRVTLTPPKGYATSVLLKREGVPNNTKLATLRWWAVAGTVGKTPLAVSFAAKRDTVLRVDIRRGAPVSTSLVQEAVWKFWASWRPTDTPVVKG
jgi:hypothetical protein